MKIHRKLANAFGYELVKLRKLNETLEQNLRNVFDLQRINCVIDVGANEGQYGRSLRELGYRGRIVSFEPVSRPYAELQEAKGGDESWWTHQLALGAKESKQTINVSRASVFSSFHAPSEYGSARFSENFEAEHREEVEVRTLDGMWSELVSGLEDPRVFLKLDTQGYDLEVLRGAEGCVASIRGMQSEISLKALYQGMPDYVSALAEFRDRGFEITGLFPVCRDKQTLALIELDCVLIRPAPASS